MLEDQMFADGHPLFPLVRTMRTGKLSFLVTLVLLVFAKRWSVFVDFSALGALEPISGSNHQGGSCGCKRKSYVKEIIVFCFHKVIRNTKPFKSLNYDILYTSRASIKCASRPLAHTLEF